MNQSPNENSRQTPTLAETATRLSLAFVLPPHPATVDPNSLTTDCDLRTQRRSGPGGQHRNKTESGVFLTHRATGIVGEATEKRSQAENRSIALQRLRFRLAIQVRTISQLDLEGELPCDIEMFYRKEFSGVRLRMNDSNVAKPVVLALMLNDLHAAGGQPSLVAKHWKISTSSLTSLLKSHPPAMELVNQIREHHGRRALK